LNSLISSDWVLIGGFIFNYDAGGGGDPACYSISFAFSRNVSRTGSFKAV